MSIKEKYPNANYEPNPNCKFCNGKGERYVSKESSVTHKEIGLVPCICIFVAHEFSTEIGVEIGRWARKEKRLAERARGI